MKESFDIPPLELGLYRHYKGNEYRVLGVGCHSETHEYFVVYEVADAKPNTPRIWIRPYHMFLETVEVEGRRVNRFQKIDEQ